MTAWNKLKKLARYLVVELRDHNTCQRCGNAAPHSKIDWAHVIGRKAKSIELAPFNSLALCAGCHFWFDGDNRKAARDEWWAVKWPDRAIRLAAWRANSPPKIDVELERYWLEAEIQRLERK